MAFMMLFFGLNLVVQELIKRVDGDGGDLRAPEKNQSKAYKTCFSK